MTTNWISETEINNYIVYISYWITKSNSEIVHLYISHDFSSFSLFCFSDSSFIEIGAKDYSALAELYNINTRKPVKQQIFEIADNFCKLFCNWNN